MFGQEKAQTQAAHAQGAPRVRMTRPRLVAASAIRGERRTVTTEGREATRYAEKIDPACALGHQPGRLGAMLLLYLVFLVATVFACNVTEDEVEQAELDIADTPIELRVTASQMYDNYQSNKIAANLKYDGVVLAVSGTVEDFGGGDGSAYYIDLVTGDFTLESVRCHFSRSHLDDIASIRKGDRVTLRGKGDEGEDRDPFTIDVVGCSVLKEE